MSYPVSLRIEPRLEARNRLTTALRPILAIPHSILVGPIYFSSRSGGIGLLGAAAYVLAIVSWFTLLVTGRQPAPIREFSIDVPEPAYPRDSVTVGLRLLLAIPHVVVLALLLVVWFVTTVIAWVAILVTGSYPVSLYPFGRGVMQWGLRVEAYVLLLTDEYPPFRIE